MIVYTCRYVHRLDANDVHALKTPCFRHSKLFVLRTSVCMYISLCACMYAMFITLNGSET